MIFFEGKDKKIINRFGKKLGITPQIGSGDTAVIGIGGFGKWTRVLETAWTFRNVLQIDVAIFALFDRDYRDAREIEQTVKAIESEGIRCAIWGRKEIENYALEMPALVRCIRDRCAERSVVMQESEIVSLIDSVSDTYRHDVHAQMATQRSHFERKNDSRVDLSECVKSSSIDLERIWKDLSTRLTVIPGKEFVSDLSSALQQKCHVTVTLNMIIDEMRRDELSPELSGILRELATFSAGAH